MRQWPGIVNSAGGSSRKSSRWQSAVKNELTLVVRQHQKGPFSSSSEYWLDRQLGLGTVPWLQSRKENGTPGEMRWFRSALTSPFSRRPCLGWKMYWPLRKLWDSGSIGSKDFGWTCSESLRSLGAMCSILCKASPDGLPHCRAFHCDSALRMCEPCTNVDNDALHWNQGTRGVCDIEVALTVANQRPLQRPKDLLCWCREIGHYSLAQTCELQEQSRGVCRREVQQADATKLELAQLRRGCWLAYRNI